MAKRDMTKTVEKARMNRSSIDPAYDIGFLEINELHDMCVMEDLKVGYLVDKQKLFDMIITAFHYGHVLGQRQERARQKAKQKEKAAV